MESKYNLKKMDTKYVILDIPFDFKTWNLSI